MHFFFILLLVSKPISFQSQQHFFGLPMEKKTKQNDKKQENAGDGRHDAARSFWARWSQQGSDDWNPVLSH